ncbi:MAG: AAA-like domain-containing protein [Candidatus Aminicenantes bacterium]|nr:AAA-like domain-containing protein [Candidatus Aminicenantes bacterium]
MNNSILNASTFYITGGTLNPDAPSYIVRKADRELCDHILAGDICYVLTPRQMGKSSLMLRTAKRLEKEGILTATVDLSVMDSQRETEDADRWYYGFADNIVSQLDIKIDLAAWWDKKGRLPYIKRLTEFFKEVMLENIKERVVIAVDEIDSTINLSFSDDFFAAIRACYNARAAQPEYRRLSFVLLGVATPAQLIKDPTRTPFNIGKRIELTDFTFAEAQPLSRFLCENREKTEAALERILYWTGGHPYLTQRLCSLTAEKRLKYLNAERIDNLVDECFFKPNIQEDTNLSFVYDRLQREKQHKLEILKLYMRIHSGRPVFNKPLSLIQAQLKLTGLVVPRENQRLTVRNRIYERIFSKKWLKEVIPTDWNRIITSISISLLIFVIFVWFIIPGLLANIIRKARSETPENAYRVLRLIPGYGGKADQLLAGYWERRGIHAETDGNREKAILYRLQALGKYDRDKLRCEINRLIESGYKNVKVTIRHEGELSHIALSPDGKTVLALEYNGTMRLWNADTGKQIGMPITHNNIGVLSAVFSHNGGILLTGDGDGAVRLWWADTGKSFGTPMRHNGPVHAVAFSPDDRFMITGSDDLTARLWRVDNSEPVGRPMQHDSWVREVVFSPDGERVLTSSAGNKVRLWKTKTGSSIGNPRELDGQYYDAIFTRDDAFVLSGSGNIIQSFYINTGRLIETKPDVFPVYPLDIKEQSRLANITYFDGRLRLTQIPFEKLRFNESGEIIEFYAPVRNALISPGGKKILSNSDDNRVRVWKTISDDRPGILEHDETVLSIAVSPDESFVLTGSADGVARLFNIANGELLGHPMVHDGPVRFVSFSKDNKTILSAGDDKRIRLWRLDKTPVGKSNIKHKDRILGAVFSPSGRILLTGSVFSGPRLWNVASKTRKNKIGYRYFCNPLAFSPTGKTIAIGNLAGSVALWQRRGGKWDKKTKEIKHNKFISTAAFSPDGKILLTGSLDNTVRLWEVKNVQPVGTPLKHEGWVTAAAFSSDGKTIITGSYDKTARLWDTETSESVSPPLVHPDAVTAVAISPDNKLILTGSKDSTLRLWQWSERHVKALGQPLKLDDSILAVFFSEDSKTFLAATYKWVHQAFLSSGRIEPKASRLLPGTWTGAYLLLDPDGNRVQVAVRVNNNSIEIINLMFHSPYVAPLKGDSQILLRMWQRKLRVKTGN